MSKAANHWQRVVFASELPKCDCCGEPFCPKHKKHYAECECIGPTHDGCEYMEIKGKLYGRRFRPCPK